MSIQDQEIEKLRDEIKKEIHMVLKANMKIFDWDIPENDDRKSAELIFNVMREAVDELGADIAAGKYDNY